LSDQTKKKHKKRKRENTEEEPLERESKKTKSDAQGENPALETVEPVADWRTPAQKAFDTVQEQRKQILLEKNIAKSHRQKIDEFNEKLSKLSEHYDIPKVGPG